MLCDNEVLGSQTLLLRAYLDYYDCLKLRSPSSPSSATKVILTGHFDFPPTIRLCFRLGVVQARDTVVLRTTVDLGTEYV